MPKTAAEELEDLAEHCLYFENQQVNLNSVITFLKVGLCLLVGKGDNREQGKLFSLFLLTLFILTIFSGQRQSGDEKQREK